jgi:hypothetical protein
MAHYAFLDNNNIVTEVIVGRNEDEKINGITDWEEYYGSIRNQRCLRTSYNGNIRKNYAGIGFSYDNERDAFIPPKIYNKWILNEDTCNWEPPVEYPLDGKIYVWNDNKGEWEELVN